MKIVIAMALMVFLAACERSPEYMEENADERFVESAERLCESHGGIYRYWVMNLKGASDDNPHVECYNGARFNVRTEEAV